MILTWVNERDAALAAQAERGDAQAAAQAGLGGERQCKLRLTTDRVNLLVPVTFGNPPSPFSRS
jgi:hypothetical protein